MERKPFAISSYTNNQYIVICDDGTIWKFSVHPDGTSWDQLPSVPQPPSQPPRSGF